MDYSKSRLVSIVHGSLGKYGNRGVIANAANFVRGGFRQKISTVGIFLYFKPIERSDVPVGSIQLGNIR